jgi:hypothetical protein
LWDASAITAPKMMALNVGRFSGSGVGNVPNFLTGFCGRRGPKRHTLFTYLTHTRAYEFSGCPNKFPSHAILFGVGMVAAESPRYMRFLGLLIRDQENQ